MDDESLAANRLPVPLSAEMDHDAQSGAVCQYQPEESALLCKNQVVFLVYNLFMPLDPTASANKSAAKTYFGMTALIIGIISSLFAGASYGIVYLKISPGLFNRLNNLTALFLCSLTPITVILGVMGIIRKNDSKPYSLIAITLVTIPFLVVLVSLVNSFMR